jgi:Na+-driven multidrug efflux pump
VRRIAGLSFAISAAIFVVLNLTPSSFLVFYGQGAEFIAEGIPVVRVISIALLLMSFSTVWLNSVIGTGKTMVNLVIETVTIVIYSVYVYVVLEYYQMPITWGWASEWVYWISMFSMAYFYMRSMKWKRKSALEKPYLAG